MKYDFMRAHAAEFCLPACVGFCRSAAAATTLGLTVERACGSAMILPWRHMCGVFTPHRAKLTLTPVLDACFPLKMAMMPRKGNKSEQLQ
jgi:hypothetical protein